MYGTYSGYGVIQSEPVPLSPCTERVKTRQLGRSLCSSSTRLETTFSLSLIWSHLSDEQAITRLNGTGQGEVSNTLSVTD